MRVTGMVISADDDHDNVMYINKYFYDLSYIYIIYYTLFRILKWCIVILSTIILIQFYI